MTHFMRRFEASDDSSSHQCTDCHSHSAVSSSGTKKRPRESGITRPHQPKLASESLSFAKKRHREDEGARPQRPRLVSEKPIVAKKRPPEEHAYGEQKKQKRDSEFDRDNAVENPNELASKRIVEPVNDENAAHNQPRILSMYNYTLRLLNKDIKQQSEKIRKSRVPEKWEADRLAKGGEVECEGDMRCRLMDEAIAYIEKKGLEYSPQQKVILKGARAISLAQFYGDSIQYHLPRLLGAMGSSELRSEMLVFMARRQGKSTVTGVLGGCELVTQPHGHDICVYANNGRASRLFMMIVYKFVRILSAPEAGFGGKIKNLNKNESMSYLTRWGTINKCSAFPAKEENLRGTGSTETTGTVIIDEIGYVAPPIVSKIIAPTLVRKRVKLIGITTISGFDSPITPLSDARYPDGRKVLLTLNFEGVCEDCKARGEPEKCKCLMADLPHWHLSSQLEKLEILLANNLDTYMREMKNLASDSSITPAFDPRDVAFLRKPDCMMRMTEISAPRIFTSVDPACGGDMSKMAIVSMIYVDGLAIIVGYDQINATGLFAPAMHGQLVHKHIMAVRQLPGLAGADVIFVPESNSGNESQHYSLYLIEKRVPRVYLMDEDKKHIGLRTDNSAKKRMAILFSHALRAHIVRFHPLMVVTNEEHTPTEMRETLIKQLGDFKRKIIIKNRGNEDDGTLSYTEVYGGKHGGRKDDGAIGVMLNYIGRVIYMQKYENVYREKKPLWAPV